MKTESTLWKFLLFLAFGVCSTQWLTSAIADEEGNLVSGELQDTDRSFQSSVVPENPPNAEPTD